MMDNRQEITAIHLQQCLDLILNENRPVEEALRLYPEEVEELGPLIDQAVYLQLNSSAFDPDPQFVQVSRQRLMRRLSETQGSTYKPATRDNWWNWLLNLGENRALAVRFAVAMILILCLFTGGTGVAFASQNTVPGDSLYGVKIGLEDLTLTLTPDQARNAMLNMQYAERRLVEIQTLQEQGHPELVGVALMNYQKHVEQATRVMDQVVQHDPVRGAQIANLVQEKVAIQLAMLANLAKASVGQTQSDMVVAKTAAEHSLEAAQRITGVSGPLPKTETPALLTPTRPLVVVNTATSAPVNNPTGNPTALPTDTSTPYPGFIYTTTVQSPGVGLPEVTLTPTMTVTATLTATPVPTVRIIEPEETERAHPTKKPHPTHPPTKTPKPKPSKTKAPGE
jgi:Domain of unknown function (DUF5667)